MGCEGLIGPDTLEFIQRIDVLWDPVYPHLARHVSAVYGRRDGTILEVGPFSGVLGSLAKGGVGDRHGVASFPVGMARFFRRSLEVTGLEEKVHVIETDGSLSAIREGAIDFVVFRGALFFPSLFRVDYPAIARVLTTGGVALIGGGFGKYTPPDVIRPIAEESKSLNLRIGKTEARPERIEENIRKSGARLRFSIFTEGGLWVVMRK